MNETTTLRPRFGQVLTVVVGLIVLAGLVSFVIVGDYVGLGKYVALMLLLAFLPWLLFWSPSVTVDPGGVVIRNLIREHRVTWPAIERIDTRFALELFTPKGKITAWAAPAPSRNASQRAAKSDLRNMPESTYGPGGSIRPGDLTTSLSGQASYLVRQRWDALRDAGHLDAGVVEGTGVKTRWLWVNIAVLVVLVVATLVSLGL